VVKFHFANPNLRERHFHTETLIGKYRIPNPGLPPLSDANGQEADSPRQAAFPGQQEVFSFIPL